MSKSIKQGQRGTYSGFPAVFVRYYSGAMVEVRVPGGLICIDVSDFKVVGA